MSDAKVNVTEVVVCVTMWLLGAAAAASVWYVYANRAAAGYGPMLGVGIALIVSVILSGIGSFVAFQAMRQTTLSLKRCWSVGSRLNYILFVCSATYLVVSLLK